MVKVQEILSGLPYVKVIGNAAGEITEPIAIDVANERADVIMWCNEKNLEKLYAISSGVVLCPPFDESRANAGVVYIVTSQPRLAFQQTLKNHFYKDKRQGIEPSASVNPSVKIGLNVYIGHNVVVEHGCKIGDDTKIDHNTVIKHSTHIGNNVTIGSNCTVGGIGYGYEKNEEGMFELMPHMGNVVLEDDVEIGNNTCIDRAVLGSTILKKNVKVDNLVHIAHGVVVGENSMVIANAMVAGSVKIGKNTWVAPSASILNQKSIGDDVTIGLGAVVLKDVPDGKTQVGNPSEDIAEYVAKRKAVSSLLKN